MEWSRHTSDCWIDERHNFDEGPKAGLNELRRSVRDARRNLKHARSLETSKLHGRKVRRIGQVALAAAIKWHGLPSVSAAIKSSKDAQESEESIEKLYAVAAKP